MIEFNTSHLPYTFQALDTGSALVADADCLFVGAGGFEDRALAVLDHLSVGTTLFRAAIVLAYSGNREDLGRAEQMADAISDYSESPVRLLEVESERPTSSSHVILDAIADIRDESAVSSALIDVSGTTQMFGIALIHACQMNRIRESIFYSEAASYFPLRSEVDNLLGQVKESGTYDYWELLQSEGLRSVHIHPEFAGSFRVGHPAALAVFLGYEPSRVRGLLDEYSPSAVVALYGVPPHADLSWRNDLSRTLHSRILERWPSAETDVSTFDVDDVYSSLGFQYESLGSSYDMAIALQCSKLQMISTYWFWREHPEVQLVFTCPISFNRSRYSSGIGRRFLLSRSGGPMAVMD